ncbi:hypothetical protein ACFQY5_17350 [Paeniroseomonas aquatica]|uniref:Uncharacterized protein n=1 Tax=Paeniroseomonas aquatica TaxID=373043 RepID=A0ABT8A4R8_9PROT|nr:hypothetical protein [Paeniroseomonas aquatica]MDN3564523.1 hypothetical protein [Paeniroseomonas aquatica]
MAQIEAHAALILRLVDAKSDMMLWGIEAELAQLGVSAGIGAARCGASSTSGR